MVNEQTPIDTPEPPHETSLGKDSTPADDIAQVQEDALIADEVAEEVPDADEIVVVDEVVDDE